MPNRPSSSQMREFVRTETTFAVGGGRRRADRSRDVADVRCQVGWSLLAANAAPWLTIPFVAYRACAPFGPPMGAPSQIVSPGAHRLMVLSAYRGPTTTGGAPASCIHRSDG